MNFTRGARFLAYPYLSLRRRHTERSDSVEEDRRDGTWSAFLPLFSRFCPLALSPSIVSLLLAFALLSRVFRYFRCRRMTTEAITTSRENRFADEEGISKRRGGSRETKDLGEIPLALPISLVLFRDAVELLYLEGRRQQRAEEWTDRRKTIHGTCRLTETRVRFATLLPVNAFPRGFVRHSWARQERERRRAFSSAYECGGDTS